MLKLGVIGIGIGGGHGAAIHKSEFATLNAICSRTAEKMKKRLETYKDEIGAEPTGYLDVDEMLTKESLDGVVVATPSGTHAEIACKVLEKGIPVLIDKPIEIKEENIQAIEKMATLKNLPVGVIYGSRCKAIFTGIKAAIDQGLLGKLLICDMRMKWHRDQAYYDKGGWRGTWEMDGGGSLMNQGAHPLDLITWFCGRAKTVTGEFGCLNHKIETEDWSSGVIVFENGVRATLSTTTCVFPKTDSTYFEVHGTKGSIFIKDGEVISSSVENLEKLAVPAHASPVLDFIDALKNKRAPMVNIKEASRSVRLINALYKSGREGRRIEL